MRSRPCGILKRKGSSDLEGRPARLGYARQVYRFQISNEKVNLANCAHLDGPFLTLRASAGARTAVYFGAKIQTMRLPWCEGGASTLPTSSSSLTMWSMTLRPSSTWAISRPRKMTETNTLSFCKPGTARTAPRARGIFPKE